MSTGEVSLSGCKVVLIGGCYGVGKHALALRIAGILNASLSHVDDFRLVLQHSTMPLQSSDLHFFIKSPGVPKEGIFRLPPEQLCDALKKEADIVSKVLETVIASHITTGQPVVLVGDCIVPSLAAKTRFAGIKADNKVRSVFIYEPDDSFFLKDIKVMDFNSDKGHFNEAWNEAMMRWQYGRWLAEEANSQQLPLVFARPQETLQDRVLQALG